MSYEPAASGQPALRISGLAKRYTIGARQERYRTLRQALTETALAPFRRIRHLFSGGAAVAGTKETLWALEDISLEIAQGEVVGIIGRNGAGKSTLLKVLSRITEPTRGYAEIHGRVGSLLEVGTGFHPELTGRENIFLNGAILGMGRGEIDAKLDEIVAFAEVERFLDTAVKHYSSGMYLRLAFAVAAHLDTEILLVDEVLAVGDANFQRKCLGKMSGVAREGRTVLFVSHNMAAVEALCSRAVVLDQGRVLYDGEAATAIHDYLSRQGSEDLFDGTFTRPGGEAARLLRRLDIEDRRGRKGTSFPVGEGLTLVFHLELDRPFQDLQIGVGIKNELGARVCTVAPRWSPTPLGRVAAGVVEVACRIDSLLLMPGRYLLKISVGDGKRDLETFDDLPAFEITPGDLWGSGALPQPFSQGIVLADTRWSLRSAREASVPEAVEP
ncbi:MAG: ABC transporter ATP-binding protein [Acidobacteria bacterium]|nr:ABC transporter ATP-binding protein [Acidobacteriota bacterium]